MGLLRKTARHAARLAYLAAALLAGCSTANVPLPGPEKTAMISELRSVKDDLIRFACLSDAAYAGSEADYEQSPDKQNCSDPLERKPERAAQFLTASGPGAPTEGVPYILLTDDHTKQQIVAIRGTFDGKTVIVDGDFFPDEDGILKVSVHHGFRGYARAVHRNLIENHRLHEKYKIITTGHSLGGAAALLVGLYLYVKHPEFPVAAVYTFGQPKVFAGRGAISFPYFARRVVHVIGCEDFVPMVPTGDLRLDAIVRRVFPHAPDLDDRHMGQSLYLMDDGRFWMPGDLDIERDFIAVLAHSLDDAVHGTQIDHSIDSYQRRILEATGPGRTATPTSADGRSFCTDVTTHHPIARLGIIPAAGG
jgi:hypothetical protein